MEDVKCKLAIKPSDRNAEREDSTVVGVGRSEGERSMLETGRQTSNNYTEGVRGRETAGLLREKAERGFTAGKVRRHQAC